MGQWFVPPIVIPMFLVLMVSVFLLSRSFV
jgi:hypothetical protein